MVTLYGIKTCDTVRKARKWLDAHDIDYRFHDFRADGLDSRQLAGWVGELGWEALLNRRGTTWRRLPESKRAGVDRDRAVALMLEHPALIKRPLLDLDGSRHLGFSDERYRQLFID